MTDLLKRAKEAMDEHPELGWDMRFDGNGDVYLFLNGDWRRHDSPYFRDALRAAIIEGTDRVPGKWIVETPDGIMLFENSQAWDSYLTGEEIEPFEASGTRTEQHREAFVSVFTVEGA